MIHFLIKEILAVFEAQFQRVSFSSNPLPPNYADLPAIAVYAGLLSTEPAETGQPLQPRRVPVAQRFHLEAATRGPFALEHRPLPASLSAHMTSPGQDGQALSDGKHYHLDRSKQTITFTDAAPQSGDISVIYDFTGLALVQDFVQELIIEVRAEEPMRAEHLAAVAASIVLTASEELTRLASSDFPEPHAGRFRASSHIQDIILKTATPARDSYTLTFNVHGQLKMIKEMA